MQNGAAYAWGYNNGGQLGVSLPNPAQPTPVSVTGLTSGVTAVAGGGDHSLAIVNGGVYFWGYSSQGPANGPTPVQVTGLTSGVTAIAAGNKPTLPSRMALSSVGATTSMAKLAMALPTTISCSRCL